MIQVCLFLLPTGLVPAQTVYVSRMWHNHQPIYWPEWNGNGSQTGRVQYAPDSIALKAGGTGQQYGTGVSHPDNDLNDIFGKADRIGAYQAVPRNSLANLSTSAGFCLSYSGSLIDNIRSLGANNQLGYGGGWWDGNREAKNWTTPPGGRRLELVGFTYHHSLAPLLPKSVLRKEIQAFKQAWWKAWNGNLNLSDHSKGFFPTEMAFSTEMIDVLADEGYQWVIVASHHLSRTCPTYNNQANPTGNFNIKSSPPNKADQLGPSPAGGWWFNEPNPGQASWNVSPFAYQLHRAKYVNPNTGVEKSMILVPSDDTLSYVAGYSGAQVGMISSNIAPHANDPNRPAIVLPSTDGDNAWGGGSSSWFESTPAFFSGCQSAGYQVCAVQDLVNAKPPPTGQFAHIEDGSWIFPESDYGSPYFLKWIEPPVGASSSATKYPGTSIDLETPGFALKFWSWAPVITGANWCETAEQMLLDEGGSVASWKIQAPYDWNGSTWDPPPNDVELAWHIYLCGLDSGFNYYGGLGNDDEVKPSLATRRAIEKLDNFVNSRLSANPAKDRTPPSVLRPQRFPHNPGGYTFGWFNNIPGNTSYLKKMGSEFYVWTHAYDVSGVQSISLKVRMDADGVNTMANSQNETFGGGSDVGPWITVPMSKRILPNTRAALNAAAANGQIDYFITPPHLADYYFAKISDANVAGFRGTLLDYYIEAADSRGNIHKSEIQHVFVEDDGNGAPPQPPDTPTGVTASALSHTQIRIAWNAVSGATSYAVFRGGVQIGTTVATEFTDGDRSPSTTYTYTVWAVNSAGNSAQSLPVSATTNPAPPPDFVLDGAADFASYLLSSSGMTLYAAIRGTKLYVATWSTGNNSGGANDHFIFVSDALLPSATAAAPWAKAGSVAVASGKPYIAAESTNDWEGWFNAPAGSVATKATTSAGQLEGVIDLAAAFGSLPPVVYVAAVAYGTADGGGIASQTPPVIGTANNLLEPGEFLALATPVILDRNADGIADRIDPNLDFLPALSSDAATPGQFILTWPSIPGRSYTIEYTDDLGAAWQALPGSPQVATSISTSITDAPPVTTMRRFYRVKTATP